MCDQMPIQACGSLAPEELMSLELLQCNLRKVDAHSTVLDFLLDTFHGNHPYATDDDRIVIGMNLLRMAWEVDESYCPEIRKLTSEDLLRLGYGCAHHAAA